MSCGPERFDGLDFPHAAWAFKLPAGSQDRPASQVGKGLEVSRRRISSVPVGAMIAALAVIAVVALLVLYFGDSVVLTGFVDPPVVE